jgi:hypothetical protein
MRWDDSGDRALTALEQGREARIVEETLMPGAVVSEVARRHGVARADRTGGTAQWRCLLKFSKRALGIEIYAGSAI